MVVKQLLENMMDITTGILFTDQYQLTMAQLYFKLGWHEKIVQFEHHFREYPSYGAHKAGFCINAGLETLYKWMSRVHFGDKEIELLAGQRDSQGGKVFHDDFWDYLRIHGNFDGLTLSAIPEGRVVHPYIPLTVVRGPIIMAQILETALLNKLNFQTLIATKAARIKLAAHGQLCLEFGLRRGHDLGGNAGARAALIGGADFTSNVGLSHSLGLPPKGTHAHSLIQLFLSMGYSELDAFRAYADLYPNNCILLVDTINTLESGIPNAIKVFEEISKKGYHSHGIRIDSGDLAYLCIEASNMLDKAGFEKASIVLSNDLDELTIWQIISQIEDESKKTGMDANKIVKRLVYGVGTKLITSWGSPALGGVYKLTAVQDGGIWKPTIKASENIQKSPNPGLKEVWRIYDKRGKASADVISEESERLFDAESIDLFHPIDFSKFRKVNKSKVSHSELLLQPIANNGELRYQFPSLYEIREQRDKDIQKLDAGVLRLINPHVYHVSLTEKLFQTKRDMLQSIQPKV
jgi:nicotinate phosphoribosyltransferase